MGKHFSVCEFCILLQAFSQSESRHSTSNFSCFASKRRASCRLWLWASAQQLFCTKLYKTISFHAAAAALPSEARIGRPGLATLDQSWPRACLQPRHCLAMLGQDTQARRGWPKWPAHYQALSRPPSPHKWVESCLLPEWV